MNLREQRRTWGAWTIAALLVLVATPRSVCAFGKTGHRTIGRLAELQLSESAAVAIQALLGTETLAEVSTWADEIRSDPNWDHARTFHYATVEDGDNYESSRKNPQGDIVAALRGYLRTLEDTAAPLLKRRNALKWVVHLVGDMHQPLHIGRGGDAGGNRIDIRWFGEEKTLHWLWDEGIIESTKLSFTELAVFVNNKITSEEIKAWQDTQILDWVDESIALRETVYALPEATNQGSYRYAYRNLPIVKERLAQAGVRLAGLLNAVFTEKQ